MLHGRVLDSDRPMTTSRDTESLDYPTIRHLVDAANALSLAERLVLLKGLIPGVARELTLTEFEAFVVELRLKGERFYDAAFHPGERRASRHVIGERDLEER